MKLLLNADRFERIGAGGLRCDYRDIAQTISDPANLRSIFAALSDSRGSGAFAAPLRRVTIQRRCSGNQKPAAHYLIQHSDNMMNLPNPPCRKALPGLLWLVGLVLLAPGAIQARADVIMQTRDDSDFTLRRYHANGDYLMLWIAPEYGLRPGHSELATRLAERGIEVWQVNLLENLFMTQNTLSQRQLDGTYAAELAALIHARTHKRIFLAGDSYAAATALRAARLAQQRQPATPWLAGAILFTPFTYASIPPLGQAPDFMPIVDATNIPLMIYQSRKSLTTVHFDELLSRLRTHGGPVYTKMLPQITSLFYEEPVSPEMRQSANSVAETLTMVAPRLAAHAMPQQTIALAHGKPGKASGIDIYLRPYEGNIRPEVIDLVDVNGQRFRRDDFSDKVTLINFWATWCPPCVEEIPSLNRLQQAMQGQPFELISINYAEDPVTVSAFMRKVNVEFPVLMDITGEYARRWNIITYPSTFVLDSRGVIRYGVNAAIAWDDAQVIDMLKALARDGR